MNIKANIIVSIYCSTDKIKEPIEEMICEENA